MVYIEEDLIHSTKPNQNVLEYLLGNNKVKEMMKFNPAANARTLAGDTVLPVLKAIFVATVKS